jgi:hypothetical protein
VSKLGLQDSSQARLRFVFRLKIENCSVLEG